MTWKLSLDSHQCKVKNMKEIFMLNSFKKT